MLIVGPNVLGPWVGAGVTLRSLFADWPRESLAQIHTDDRIPDASAAASYFRLNEGERLTGPFLVRQAVRHLRFARGRGETGTLFGGRITPRLARWLDKVRPQVVFSQLGGLAMGHISLEIARRRNIPLVIHISDDWVKEWPANVLGRRVFPLTHLANRAMRGVLRRAMQDAAAVTVISQEMAEGYERRYGRSSRVLHNGVDLEAWPPREAGPAGSPAGILYSGSVFRYAQLTSLEDARDAVASLRADGRAVELVIRTQHADSDAYRHAFGSSAGTVIRDLVPAADLGRTLAEADVLLLPVSFDPTTIDFIRLSIPGKLAEYLASGTPVLYYGPPDVAQARFLARHGCALMVTSRDPGALRSAIARIVDDATLRRDLSLAGRHVAEQCFDIRALRATLRSVLDEALAG